MAKKKIKITQIKSRIGYSRKAKATLDALGLRKLNQSVILDLNDAIHGMIKKIDYLIVSHTEPDHSGSRKRW